MTTKKYAVCEGDEWYPVSSVYTASEGNTDLVDLSQEEVNELISVIDSFNLWQIRLYIRNHQENFVPYSVGSHEFVTGQTPFEELLKKAVELENIKIPVTFTTDNALLVVVATDVQLCSLVKIPYFQPGQQVSSYILCANLDRIKGGKKEIKVFLDRYQHSKFVSFINSNLDTDKTLSIKYKNLLFTNVTLPNTHYAENDIVILTFHTDTVSFLSDSTEKPDVRSNG